MTRKSNNVSVHVTMHGRDEAVVVSVKEFQKLNRHPTGQSITDAMHASPFRDIELVTPGFPMPVGEF